MAQLVVDVRKVRIYMADKGIASIEELARLADVSPTTIHNYFGGQGFRSSTVDQLASILSCNPLDLLGTNGEPPPHLDAPAVAVI